ncbi:hypothetical protein ANO14919_129230 [Xylariales sp. No.14919]|nr:hypothetical protein ANO14919_129230 [Xylariales sp. No.14919]
MVDSVVAALTGILTACLFALALLWLTQDENEPATIDTWIPFINPMINTSRSSSRYWSSHSRLLVYTLRVPFALLYVVNSPLLV